MKTIVVRKFKTRNLIADPHSKNHTKELVLDLEQDIAFNKEDQIKYHVIDDDFVEVKQIKYNLDGDTREVLIEFKQIKAKTEAEFLSELKVFRDKGWYER